MGSLIPVCPLCYLLNTADQKERRNYSAAKSKTFSIGLPLAQSVYM